MATLNTASVHGWRRFVYWVLFATGVWIGIIGVASVAAAVVMAVGAFQNGRLAEEELTYLGFFIGGLLVVIIGTLLVEKFKREGVAD